jgi:hypothetical protein
MRRLERVSDPVSFSLLKKWNKNMRLFDKLFGKKQQPPQKIECATKRKILDEMFVNMRKQTNWNVDGVLLWGYFFTDYDPKKLQKAAEHLVQQGYNFVKIYMSDDGKIYWLHVERAEIHTPESLHIRNCELEKIAEEYNLESYDGMDVGQYIEQDKY